MRILGIIIVLILFISFQTIVTAEQKKESKVEVKTVVTNELILVSENGTRVKIILGNDGKFYIVAIASPPEATEE